MILSFRLSDAFIAKYVDRRVDWGYPDAAGNTLGEITFLRTYSRLKDDGAKERWYETCRRVIEGMFSLQKDHVKAQRLPWSDVKAQRAAEDAYERLFTLKWTPPGRGLAVMGTPLVNEQRNSAALQSCAFVSTAAISKSNPAEPFEFLMDASLLGVGVGFDVFGASSNLLVHVPDTSSPPRPPVVIPDTREGWVESTGDLIRSYLMPGRHAVTFDYSVIRPAGTPIKTFGGTAAGAGPLIRLHDQIRHLLDGLAGELLPSQAIMDIANMIGVCVVSGNVRRSALLSLGSADDESFVYAKDYERYPERVDYGFMSNNSVVATVDQDLSGIVDSIRVNGEPGVVWLDLARSHGRLADPPDYRDHRVAGTNPCTPSMVQVIDKRRGLVTLGDISIGDRIWSENGWVTVTAKWCTGIKEVFEARTTTGVVYATANHRVVQRGQKVELQDATHIDPLLPPPVAVRPSSAQRVMDGLYFGDGTLHQGKTYLHVGVDDYDYATSEVSHLIQATSSRSGTARRVHVSHDATFTGTVTDRRVPVAVLAGDLVTKASWLRGLYSANGSIIKDQRIALKSTNIDLILRVQTMLWELGIQSYTTSNHATDVVWDNGTYTSKPSMDLNINDAVSVERFRTTVGFLQGYKMDALMKVRGTSKSRSRKITRYTSIGEHEVWDITVDGSAHTFWSGGHNISNCGEQNLESYETCCLVETHLNRAESLADLERTLKVAYLYGKTVTLIPTHWPRTNAIMQRNRRIGTSVTGLANFADNHGITKLREWLDAGYATLKHYDTIYSEWLGVRESIKVSSVKPSGTVSLLSGASPGVHWTPGGQYFERRIRFAADDPMVDAFRAAGYPVEPAAENPDYTVVVTFPVRSEAKRSEDEVSIFEKAHLAAMAQHHWADNAVSVTVSFNPEQEGQHVGSVLSMYAGQLKSVSFLPMATAAYAQPPYTKITREEFDAYAERLLPLDLVPIYDSLGAEAVGEKYCETDVCQLKTETG